ncbi:MAG: calcium-binding protein [Arenibacterium sp.]
MITLTLLPDGTVLQTGTSASETILGDTGIAGNPTQNDEIRAGAGDDRLSGGRGQNDLFGQKGDDSFVLGQSGNEFDRAFGGVGKDTFSIINAPGSVSNVHVINGGSDRGRTPEADSLSISAFFGTGVSLARGKIKVDSQVGSVDIARIRDIEIIRGTSLEDRLRATDTMIEIRGGGGNDRIWANDTKAGSYAGGIGNDILTGRSQKDILFDGDLGLSGGRKAPNLFNDTDLLKGNGGSDTLFSYSGPDTLIGGKGNDTFYSIFGDATIRGGDGRDVVKFNYGSFVEQPLVDQSRTNRPQEQLAGLDINGGDGFDRIDFSATHVSTAGGSTDLTKGVFINLGLGRGKELSTGTDGRFIVRKFESVSGTDRDDRLIGSGVDNTIEGGAGDDVIRGKDGNDSLDGGSGNDTLTGGKGADEFLFDGGDKSDTITDFQDGVDEITLHVAGTKLTFASLIITDTVDGALIRYAALDTVLLEGVSASVLDGGDFNFV